VAAELVYAWDAMYTMASILGLGLAFVALLALLAWLFHTTDDDSE